MTLTDPLPGYDIRAVGAWISANVPSLTPPLAWTRLEGGHSNLTCLIEDRAGARAVIRRPPLGELLPRAHDMGREWTLIRALGPTAVPVPAALAFCADPGVTGAVFYVMGHIDGHPLYTADDTRARVAEPCRGRLARGFIDVLADLHALDPATVGLGDLGKTDSYVRRQLETWGRSWAASAGPAGYDDPRARTLAAVFLEHLPDQGPARIVHGDYGLHNILVGADGAVAAVVDWEIATLGDPLADLAYALNGWPDPGDAAPPTAEAATTPPGFPSRAALAARYAARTGADLTRLDYYVGFNRWKSAAIVHGVYARYVEGKKSAEGVDLDALRGRIATALTQAEVAVAKLGACERTR